MAAGAALAFRQQGSDRVALNYIGDGGTSTGEFHEGLNMAAVLDVPLVLVILNNRYAFSTPTREQYRAESLAARAAGYGIEGIQVDTSATCLKCNGLSRLMGIGGILHPKRIVPW